MAHVIRHYLLLSVMAAVLLAASPAQAQPPAASSGEMPWQVAVMFTANWVLAGVAVAILSRPNKRTDKPKKTVDEEGA